MVAAQAVFARKSTKFVAVESAAVGRGVFSAQVSDVVGPADLAPDWDGLSSCEVLQDVPSGDWGPFVRYGPLLADVSAVRIGSRKLLYASR